MEFKFRQFDYQTDAVNAVVESFKGQDKVERASYRRDVGDYRDVQGSLNVDDSNEAYFDALDETGFKNEEIHITRDTLLSNIKDVQRKNNVMTSDALKGNLGACTLDIEMETGTGKTYVYIKTMHELNEKYGWSKFIIVVPSIAIREGVKKSLETTQNHFMEQYSKKIRFFIYDSNNLTQLDSFSSDPGINVMIINMQAFNSFKDGAKNKAARIIYSERDQFGSRRPIDVLAANRPILILDEPQKMGGKATQNALQNFNPLFTINFSATHKTEHNLVYALDAVDAYNKRLVKKIEVKGFQVKNLRGTDSYVYLDDIKVHPNKAPEAKIEFEVNNKSNIKRTTRKLSVDDNLYELSNGMEQYRGFRITEIDPLRGVVRFVNGEEIESGEVTGDVAERDIRRVQIRETIKSHFEKEEELFNKGIKTLSLFFIDEVAKYRQYNDEGEESLGEYGRIFEEEYQSLLDEYIESYDTPYKHYLKNINVEATHNGYFSIDNKGRSIDGKIKKSTETSDDISAYDLILKNKERLLSFEEPTRFIFSHSALREGWDNPNIFQICTLKQASSVTMKRQEVGRGLRLAVNKDGIRMDEKTIGKSGVHELNKLTVVASESYEDFVRELQKEIKDNLYDRPKSASVEYFTGKTVQTVNGLKEVTEQEATMIYQYLVRNDYITDDGSNAITDKYHIDVENSAVAELPSGLNEIGEGVHTLIQSIFDESILEDMIDDGHETKILENDLNDNFYKKEFQELWSYINHKYTYTVSFNSKELIEKSVHSINENLYVSTLQYTTSVSEQRKTLTAEQARDGSAFYDAKTSTEKLERYETSKIKYDLIGKIVENTVLTRKTVVEILKEISSDKFLLYKLNPEEFIKEISRLINEQKAAMIVEHISYDETEEKYDSSIFTAEKSTVYEKAFKADKHIQPYVFTDGIAENSVEKKFAKDLDGAEEVSVFAKIPRGFSIPTPVGNYSPDWAIAFKAGSVKHIFFIAETKGTMESLQLRPIEQAKISCAKKLFNEISTDDVVYHDVDSYQKLLDIMPQIKKTTLQK